MYVYVYICINNFLLIDYQEIIAYIPTLTIMYIQYCVVSNDLKMQYRENLIVHTVYVQQKCFAGRKFGDFGKSSVICQTKTIQIGSYN